jgi:hypothetical protein
MDSKTAFIIGLAALAAGAILLAAGYSLRGAGAPEPEYEAPPTTQAPVEATTSTVPTTSSTVTTGTSSTSTTAPTTTTLPRYLPLNWTDLGKCKETIIGKMNSLLVDIPAEETGTWAVDPLEAFDIICDGKGAFKADRVVYRGGRTIGKGNEVGGSYRLMVKCGHNAQILDLADCKEVGIYLDTGAMRAQNTSSPNPPL